MKIVLPFSLFLCLTANAQIHWLVNKDSIPDCSLMRNGTFVAHGATADPETGTDIVPGYKLVRSGDKSIEYVDNGKNRIECTLEFDGPCKYRSTVSRVDHPYGVVKVGLVIETEILETATADRLVMIRARNVGDQWQTFVVERIE